MVAIRQEPGFSTLEIGVWNFAVSVRVKTKRKLNALHVFDGTLSCAGTLGCSYGKASVGAHDSASLL